MSLRFDRGGRVPLESVELCDCHNTHQCHQHVGVLLRIMIELLHRVSSSESPELAGSLNE